MEKKVSSKRVNRFVLLSNWGIDIFLIGGYLLEYLKGAKPLEYIIAMLAIILVPMSAASVIYIKNNRSIFMKYVTLIGYFILYNFVLFTAPTERILVFVYIFPIILCYFLYFDLKLILVSNIAFALVNVAKIIYYIVFLGIRDSFSTTDFLIQFACVFMYSLTLIISTRLSNQFSIEKLADTEKEHAKQESILKDVLKIAAVLDKNSREVHRIVGELTNYTSIASNAVQEIEKGAAETATNIQIQSGLTHDIQNLIDDTSEDSNNMEQISLNTVKAVEEGFDIIEILNNKSEDVSENSDSAYSLMVGLKNKTEEIRSISDLISGISEQTNMLSLNAAIESARAGESGKGFAVVAEEIRKLAAQSKESTNSISRITTELYEHSDRSVEAVLKLKEANNEQTALVGRTMEIFRDISNKMYEVKENVDRVNDKILKVLNANNKLVESINEISAVSQEVTASAQQASELTTQNLDKAEETNQYVLELIETSEEMSKYIN